MDTVNETPLTIGIFGTYGFGNMGDAMVADATIAGLKRCRPNAHIIGICQQPVNVHKRHGIDAISIFRKYIQNTDYTPTNSDPPTPRLFQFTIASLRDRVIVTIKSFPILFKTLKALAFTAHFLFNLLQETYFCLTIFKHLRKIDLLVIAGSGQLNDEWGGAWRYPFALFRWCLIARLTGCKIAFMSVGAGAITHKASRLFCTWAIKLAHYKSFRDANTLEKIIGWGVIGAQWVPDMAFSVQIDERVKALAVSTSPAAVCINPISFGDPRSWCTPNAAAYNRYTHELALFCDWLLEQGHNLHFIPNNIEMDNPTIDDIITQLHPRENIAEKLFRPKTETYRDVYHNIGNVDFVFASRFHGVVFALMQNIPVVALAHHYKYAELLKEMEQEKYGLNINTFTANHLKALFLQLQLSETENKTAIRENVKHYRDLTEDQFRCISRLCIS